MLPVLPFSMEKIVLSCREAAHKEPPHEGQWRGRTGPFSLADMKLRQKICINNELEFPAEIHKWKYSLERKKTDPLLRFHKISAEVSNVFIFCEMEDLQHLISSSPLIIPVTKIPLI